MIDYTRRLACGIVADDFDLDQLPESKRRQAELERDRDVSIRTVPTLGEGVTELAAVSRTGKILVRLALPTGAATEEDERWLMERARRLLPAPEKPDIRLLA